MHVIAKRNLASFREKLGLWEDSEVLIWLSFSAFASSLRCLSWYELLCIISWIFNYFVLFFFFAFFFEKKELLEGSLYSFLHARGGVALDKKFRLQIAVDIALGMSVLESSTPPLVHRSKNDFVFIFLNFLFSRDLKSPNILMVPGHNNGTSPVCKVTDFGLSKQLFGQVQGRDVFNPDWLAPEIILNQPYSISSDVFSYGTILWELMSLQHPFDEYSVSKKW